MVRPYLAEGVHLTREAAMALGDVLGLTPYDALMDGSQQGIGVSDVEPVFTAYEAFLADTLPEVERRQAAQPAPVRPIGPFPIAAQQRLCRDIAERMGLDFEHARLDQS